MKVMELRKVPVGSVVQFKRFNGKKWRQMKGVVIDPANAADTRNYITAYVPKIGPVHRVYAEFVDSVVSRPKFA